jgi:hypothetical protein
MVFAVPVIAVFKIIFVMLIKKIQQRGNVK